MTTFQGRDTFCSLEIFKFWYSIFSSQHTKEGCPSSLVLEHINEVWKWKECPCQIKDVDQIRMKVEISLPLYTIPGSIPSPSHFLPYNFLYSSNISFMSSSETFSFVFMILINLFSGICPVFWRSNDLDEKECAEGLTNKRRRTNIPEIVFRVYLKMSKRHSSSGSFLLCTETSVRYSLKETENPYRSADTCFMRALA